MKINLDSLKCVKKLERRGVEAKQAEAFITTLMEAEFGNIYSTREVDIMLSEMVKDVFREQERLRKERADALEKQIAAYERKAERQAEHQADQAEHQAERHERQLDRQIAEMRADRRWIIGTIITVGLALAGYLSALIHFTHS